MLRLLVRPMLSRIRGSLKISVDEEARDIQYCRLATPAGWNIGAKQTVVVRPWLCQTWKPYQNFFIRPLSQHISVSPQFNSNACPLSKDEEKQSSSSEARTTFYPGFTWQRAVRSVIGCICEASELGLSCVVSTNLFRLGGSKRQTGG